MGFFSLLARPIRSAAGLAASFLSGPSTRRSLGRRGEALAARHLRGQGLRILQRNFRARSGEIDLIALDGACLVLVEVKSAIRSGSGGSADRWDPLWKIDAAKARRIGRAAALFRRRSGGEVPAARIDGVVVDFILGPRGRPVLSGIRWYPALHPVDRE